MKEIKYSTRVYVDPRNHQVYVRVRWDKKVETAFALPIKADPTKWDEQLHRAKFNTIHKIGEQNCSARIVNGCIEEAIDKIATIFAEFEIMEVVPTRDLLKDEYARISEERKNPLPNTPVKQTLDELFEEFCNKCSDERNWSKTSHYKYQQVWQQLNECHPGITLETLTKEKMVALKNWYVAKGHRNITIKKTFKILKSMLRWMQNAGHELQPGVLSYQVNLTVVPKTVTFLKYRELMAFYAFEFPKDKPTLALARDMFCFMSFTSLRYSDLLALRKANVVDGHLEICTQKTRDCLTIPLIDPAKAIIANYWNEEYPGGKLFPVFTNQGLNVCIRGAAKMAGLDREVYNVYFAGSSRHEESHPFYEIISCHAARRTFVCCSLAMGIPASIVMSCTGHKDFETMKPYIEVADETQQKEMSKWNVGNDKESMLRSLENVPEVKLRAVMQLLGVG